MQESIQRSSYKKPLKVLLFTVMIVAVSILGLHIWVVNNARGVLKRFVTTSSHGKMKLEISHLRFNFFSNELQVLHAELVSTDSTTVLNSYHIKFRDLTLRVHSFFPLLLKRNLQLDSITLQDPMIEVFQWRKDTARRITKDEPSISQEVGKLYNTMLDVLDKFGIRRININNGSLSLINKIKREEEPVTVSHINFSLVRSPELGGKRDQYVNNEQSVSLSTNNQNIVLPGGRHRISFKTFNLELFQKRIELNDCTVTAIPTDSSKSSYKIFFKKLLLIGVDFSAMDRFNLIKADSVYCEKPSFNIHLEGLSDAAKKKEKPDAQKIMRDLWGDLDLAFIGVKDAAININIIGKKNRALLNTNKDNFEMRGLRINADSSTPVEVKRFDMLVRNYHLYNEDSSIAYAFDSVRFINNKIILNNFSVTTESGRFKERSQRDFKIPYFELTGINWYQLIFEQNLKAQEAFLSNPVISYVKNIPAVHKKRTSLFSFLQGLDSLMTLDKVNIVNGTIHMQMGPSASVSLQGVDLGVYSNQLLAAHNKEGLRRAVDLLTFKNGIIKLKDITAQLENVRSTSDNFILADKVSFSVLNKLNATVRGVSMDNMILDEEASSMLADGLRWNSANINIQNRFEKSKPYDGRFIFKNINGNNTNLTFSNANTNVNTFIRSIKASSFSKEGNLPPKVDNLSLSGNNLMINHKLTAIKAASYLVSNSSSYLNDVHVENIKQQDSILIKSPHLDFAADINSLFSNNIHLTNLDVQEPVFMSSSWNKNSIRRSAAKTNSSLFIDHITATEPAINISTHRNDSVTVLSIPRSDLSEVKASSLKINDEGMQINSLFLNTTAATYQQTNGHVSGVEKGKVLVQLSNIKLNTKEDNTGWSGIIDSLYLKSPNTLTVGKHKNKLSFKEFGLTKVSLSSIDLEDLNEVFKSNLSASMHGSTGEYIGTQTFKWFNASYNAASKNLSIDSFIYHPTLSRDSLIATTPYQTDYVTFNSGPLNFLNFNSKEYTTNNALIADSITISQPVITIFRDKKPPFLSGVVKPLPVEMIKKLNDQVDLQGVSIVNGSLTYTERNAKSREEATLLLTKLNGGFWNIKNSDFGGNDSLLLVLNGYLMDSAFINLKIKESYNDSLSGFLMTVRIKQTPLSILNPILLPLSNVIITSGTIDSVHVSAIGRNDLALGKMNMYYHNLRIKLVKDGNVNSTTFKTRLLTFIANTFLIKKNNNGGTGLVYVNRLTDHSFFNYIIKMTFSGIATSVGVKKNNKYLKQYKNELQKRDLPAIEFD